MPPASAAEQTGGAFALVSELGMGNFTVERFEDERSARTRAAAYWCVWVLFQQQSSGELSEVAAGGLGLEVTRNGIRKHANETLNPHAACLAFTNRAGTAVGNSSIASGNRVVFGIIYPTGLGKRSSFMFFDKEKLVEQLVAEAAGRAGLVLDKGKLAGSPERLNLFTLDGDIVRLDLEVSAHLGSTLNPNDVLVLEKGNRLNPSRLRAIRSMLS